MRKILTREEKNKKDTRNKLIIGVILILVLIISTAGYAFFSRSEEEETKKKFKDTEFILTESGLWYFKLNEGEFSTQFTPEDTQNISVPIFRNLYSYSGKPLFFAGESPGKQEIARNVINFLSRYPQDACINDYESLCKEDSPIKNCSQDNIIILQEENETEISQEENCIFISAPYAEQIRASDAFLFKILGLA